MRGTVRHRDAGCAHGSGSHLGGNKRGDAGLCCCEADTCIGVSPLVSLLMSMAVTPGSAWAASKCSSDRPPFKCPSVWQTAQYFFTNAFCWAAGIKPAVGEVWPSAIGYELDAAVTTRKAEVLRIDGMLFTYWEAPPQIYQERGGLDSVGLFECAVTEADEKTIPLMFAS